jgi:parvulin-like peptidyl-prolyl isomerase
VVATPALTGAEPARKPATVASPKRVDAPAKPKAEVPAKANAIPDLVAVVEGVEIKKAELDKALSSVLAQSGRSSADIPDEEKSGAYRMILDDLITEKLITKRAADVKVNDEEVEATFQRYTANFGSEEEIKKQIEKGGQTVEKVKEDIRSSLRQQHWVESQLKGAGEVADGEAEEFYKQNPQQFKMPERVRASHILVSVKPDATSATVVEKEKAAQAILVRVKKGEDFTKVAQEVSEDPSAKQNGGDLDFFAKEQMVPEFSDVAFKMKKDEISQPVRSQFGFHIIKVTDRKEPETVPLEKAKPQLLAYLKQQKKQAEVEKLVRGIREKADVKINLPAPSGAPTLGAPAKAAP